MTTDPGSHRWETLSIVSMCRNRPCLVSRQSTPHWLSPLHNSRREEAGGLGCDRHQSGRDGSRYLRPRTCQRSDPRRAKKDRTRKINVKTIPEWIREVLSRSAELSPLPMSNRSHHGHLLPGITVHFYCSPPRAWRQVFSGSFDLYFGVAGPAEEAAKCFQMDRIPGAPVGGLLLGVPSIFGDDKNLRWLIMTRNASRS